MKPRSAASECSNPLFIVALCFVMLWPVEAVAQLDSTSFGPLIPRGSSALYTFAVAAGDLDGDGFADLVVSDQCGLDGLCNLDRHTGVQVMINNGDGSFDLGTRYATDHDGGSPQSVAIADVDGDHKLDVIVMNASGWVSVMLGNGDGTLQPAVSYPLSIYDQPAGVSPDRLAVADVNGDGKPDILVSDALNYTNRYDASQFRGGVSVLLNQGNGTFANAVLYDSGGYYGAPDIRVVDVNHDGFPDVVVLNICSVSTDNRVNGSPCNDAATGLMPGTVGVLLGNDNGTFQQAITYPSGGYGPVGLAVADLDRDGNPDVLVANQCSNVFCNSGVSGGKVSVLMGNSDGSFDAPVNYDDGTVQPVSVAVADIDGDGAADAAVLNYCTVGVGCDGLTGIVAGLPGNGDGTLQTPVPPAPPLYPVGVYTHTVLLVDVNNDGKPDLVVGFWTGVGVRLNQTPRSATATTLLSQPNPSGDGETVTFTATVSSSTPGVPTGTVTFREGAAVLGTADLVNAVATLDVSDLTVGSHKVVASYSSDDDFRASDSAPLTQVVKATTSTSVDSSANPSTFQQSVTFTATVTATLGGTPTGSVTFKDGVTILGTSALSGNTASIGTSSLSVGPHSITAEYEGDASHLSSASSPLSQTVVVAVSVAVNPTAVTGGTSSTGTVTLSHAAPAGGTVVTLASSDTASATVAASVAVAAGTTTKTFTVTSKPVAAQALVTISATSNGTTGTAVLTVNPAVLTSLTVSPASVIGGGKPKGTVTLNGKAPSGGAVVTLSSADLSATVPASVKVAAGATSATFTITTTPVATTVGPFNISASYHAVTWTAPLTVLGATPSKLTVGPSSVIGGVSSKGTVTLTGAAGAGGAVVALASASSAATPPASVTVPAGFTSATFTITTIPVATTQGPFDISATYNGVTAKDTLTVKAATLSSVVVTPSSVIGFTPASGTVMLTGNAPAGGAFVNLTSANTAAATVQGTVTVNAGTNSATFPINTWPVAASTSPFNISATYSGVTRSDTLIVKAPAVLSLALNPTTVIGGGHSKGTVTLTGIAPLVGTVVILKSSNTAVATVLPSTTVPDGKPSVEFDIATVPVAGATTITISATGGGTTKNATLTVTP